MSSVAKPAAGTQQVLARVSDLVLPVGIVASLLVILVPLPAELLDLLLSANIAVAVIMLLTAVYVRTPLEFSVFPSLLLATTLARLVLNIATTRLILTRTDAYGLDAAGGVVRGFGEFVAGDRVAVGLIIFSIIVVIQFVVITKGATRISEVAARFMLDGMPGRQMAVDADLGAGVIDETEARRRRREITQQADFFGAMDGASKFVRGDAIAGIVITLVNIVGGLYIGVVESGMSLSEAGSMFTKLTIGDGLVAQVPAFLISVAAGLLVTRSTTESNLPLDFVRQMFSRPQALVITAAFLGILTFTGLPSVPLLLIGGSTAGLAVMLTRQEKAAKAAAAVVAEPPAKPKRDERPEDFLAIDPLEVEVSASLIRLADPKRGGDLLERVSRVRQSMAAELGILMPKVRIRDNLRLAQNHYRIKLADAPVAERNVYPGLLLATLAAGSSGRLAGIEAREPARGTTAVWIEPSERRRAEALGYSVIEPAGAIVTHLAETVRSHADELLTRDAAKHLIEELRKTSPAVVDELIPGVMKLAEVQQILQMLLREQVSIRHLGPILEALGDHAPKTRDPVRLVENIRQRMARSISGRYCDAAGRLRVVTLSAEIEDRVRGAIEYGEGGWRIRIPPDALEDLCHTVGDAVDRLVAAGYPAVVLVAPELRAGLKQLTAAHLPQLVVLSYAEVVRETTLETVAVVRQAAA